MPTGPSRPHLPQVHDIADLLVGCRWDREPVLHPGFAELGVPALPTLRGRPCDLKTLGSPSDRPVVVSGQLREAQSGLGVRAALACTARTSWVL